MPDSVKKRKRLDQSYEFAAMSVGFSRVAGVDEAGRGPLAGPVVVAAVVLGPGCSKIGINDSKKITPKKREILYDLIIEHARAYKIVSVGVVTIDRLNILRATLLGMKTAVLEIPGGADFVYIDGPHGIDMRIPQVPLIDGDARCCSVAAASILAKVARDRQMVEYDDLHPGYGFARHKGYGTKEHLEALRSLGPSPIHRRSFAPVAELVRK
jgi:ribonuclease HII